MSAITAKASRKMKKYAVLTREPRSFLGSFDFSWEQRKLGDIADIVGGGTPSTGNQSYWDGDIDWYAPAEIADQIYANSSQKKITGLGYENSSAKMLPPGTVLFTSRAGIGKTAILTRKGCTNQGFQSIVPHRGELDSYFIFSRTGELKRYGELVGAGSTFVEVSGKQMAVMELMMPPTMREQQTIGGFFQQLDHLITLHQRKCANLCSPSQVVFSLLFATSTFSWEQRKVQDVADRFDNLRIPVAANLRVHGTTPYYGANGIQDYVEGFTHDGEFVLVAEDGANDLKNYPVKCVNGRIWVNNHAHVLQGKAGISDNSFLAFAISQSDIESLLVGGSRAKLNAETLMSIEFKLPCLQEQYRIGEYLTQLDHLITLHQRECISFTGRADRLILTANKKRTTSSWEQRKFGEITSKYEDPVPTPHDGYYRLGIRSHAKGTFHSYVAKGQELETAQMHRVAAGNFIVNITFGWEHAVAITDKNDAGKLVSHRFPQFSFAEGMVPEFFRYVIVDEKFRHHLWLASPGGAGRNRVLKLDEMLNYLMRFPSRDEQIKIAEFFRHLDNLITLHQRKPFLMKWRTSDANRNQTNRLVL